MVPKDKEMNMRKLGCVLLAVAAILAATVTNAAAGGPVAAPEVRPASRSGGLALLAGGVLLVRARLRK